jgi:anti-sigma factor RsiW
MQTESRHEWGNEDAQLVALIDGELDEAARCALEARLTADPDLRARLAQLLGGGRPFAPAFRALLDDAPVERLRSSLAAIVDVHEQRQTPVRRYGVRARQLAAAAAIVLFCAGLFAGRYGPRWPTHSPEMATATSDREEDWRQAVAEYMTLYTADTFATEPALQEQQLAALGAKIDLALTPQRVALANLQLKGAQIFAFQGAPLGQLGYVDPSTGPVLFCIIRNSEPNAAMVAQRRGGFAVASWARDGRGYMLIGRLPTEETTELAHSLEERF